MRTKRERFHASRRLAAMILLVVLAAVAVYFPLYGHDFLLYDDKSYITDNLYVRTGLSWRNVVWSFTTLYKCNWHPLAWISHMLDVELFGLNAGAHHLVSLAIHVANAAAMLSVLHLMTGALWPSALTAFFFAVHPLHVESVAWIAERKDVLAAFFWMATMAAYLGYCRRPSLKRLLMVIFCFALGLAAKAMAVTLPFALLLLDFWPLGRAVDFRPSSAGTVTSSRSLKWLPLLAEKVPLLILSAAASLVALLAQAQSGAIASLETVPLGARLLNIPASYAWYLLKTVWPVRLAVIYPHTGQSPAGQGILSLALMAVVTAMAVRWAKRCPAPAVGWLWFLGTLVPVIGLVQIGIQSRADRYSYVPLIGIFIMIAWGASCLLPKRRFWRLMTAVAAMVAAAAFMWLSSAQVRHWRDGITLFKRAAQATDGNWYAYANLGAAYGAKGLYAEEIEACRRAITIKSDFAEPRDNLGIAYLNLGRTREAEAAFQDAIRVNSADHIAHEYLGIIYGRQGRFDEALAFMEKAAKLAPNDAGIANNLGIILHGLGRAEEAAGYFQKAIRRRPDLAEAHFNLGLANLDLDRNEEAAASFAETVRLSPDHAGAHFNLGKLHNLAGDRSQAIAEYEILARIDERQAAILRNLIRP